MASVWCCVQICSLLTQCCLSLASVAEREGGGSGRWVSEQPGYGHTGGASASILHAPPSVDNGACADQYETKQSARKSMGCNMNKEHDVLGATVAQDKQLTVQGLKVVWSRPIWLWPSEEDVNMPLPYDKWERLQQTPNTVSSGRSQCWKWKDRFTEFRVHRKAPNKPKQTNIISQEWLKTHPWACTVLHWWHWRWRCVSPRRSVRWRHRPEVASRGAFEVATARWQSTRADLVHCSRQKTWKQQQQRRTAGQLVNTLLLRPSRHYLNGIKVDYSNEFVWQEPAVELLLVTSSSLNGTHCKIMFAHKREHTCIASQWQGWCISSSSRQCFPYGHLLAVWKGAIQTKKDLLKYLNGNTPIQTHTGASKKVGVAFWRA